MRRRVPSTRWRASEWPLDNSWLVRACMLLVLQPTACSSPRVDAHCRAQAARDTVAGAAEAVKDRGAAATESAARNVKEGAAEVEDAARRARSPSGGRT